MGRKNKFVTSSWSSSTFQHNPGVARARDSVDLEGPEEGNVNEHTRKQRILMEHSLYKPSSPSSCKGSHLLLYSFLFLFFLFSPTLAANTIKLGVILPITFSSSGTGTSGGRVWYGLLSLYRIVVFPLFEFFFQLFLL